MKKQGMLGWLYTQIGDKKPSFVASVITAIIEVFSGFVPFILVSLIVRDLINGVTDMNKFGLYIGLMAVFFILRVVFHMISTTFSHVATFHVLANIRSNALDKLSRMQLGDVLARKTGTLKNIIFEKVDSMETTMAHMIPDVTANLIGPLGILIILFVIDWRMALASLVSIPIGAIAYTIMMVISMKGCYFEKSMKATQNLNDATVEYINGMEVIKVFGKTESSYKKFESACNEGANTYVNWMKKTNIHMNFALAVFPASMLGILPIGAALLLGAPNFGIDKLVESIIVSLALIQPLVTLMSYSDDVMAMSDTLNTVRGILDAKEMERPATISEEDKPRDNSVSLQDVHFAYQEADVLHGINIDIASNEYVALVGPSGSGKSTIAKLIAGMWDVKSGSISIGGTDITKIPADMYQDYVAYVSQDNYLFNTNVMENIRMGKTDGVATDEEVIEVAKKSGCYDFIMSLEKGFDTVVGSAGGHLSGGERQRISIARAMLKNAPIVILDEATAYTDPENEAVIQDSVSKLVKDKTLIVIAHRLSTITGADKIICINDGNVEEVGTHEELLKKGGLYEKMWDAHISAKDSKEDI